MKPAVGELISSSVIISKPKDVGRFYQKSQFGKTTSENTLELNLIESAFLLEEGKLIVFQNKTRMNFDDIISQGIEKDHLFEEKYLVFRDLRNRGIQTLFSKEKEFSFTYLKKSEQHPKGEQQYILVISEREEPSLFNLQKLIEKAEEKKGILWLGIVDEEGDITYYIVDIIQPKGSNQSHSYNYSEGIVLSNRVVLFNENVSKQLYEKEFFGKPFAQGLQLAHVEALYLMENNILEIYSPTENDILSKTEFRDYISFKQSDIFLRYKVFEDLKNKGLIVKTGFKFGTHFRAYQTAPFRTHAEYLIHAIDTSYQTQWSEISRAVRLAHAVNKKLLFALVKNEEKPPEYLCILRLRP